MTTAIAAETMFGNKLYQKRARKVLPILVRQANARETITYQNLANEIGIPNPRNLNYILGSVGETLLELSVKWNEKIPLINCLVVNKNTQLPGEGIGWFISSIEDFKKLSRRFQRERIDRFLQEVFEYQRWDEVLAELGLEPTPKQDYTDLQNIITTGIYGGGEGEEHKRFKEYISQNPQIVDLPRSIGVGKTEYCLPSADKVDVFFINGNDWVIVEAKSRISDEADLYRGIYQCIKYQAVVEANQLEKNVPQNCRVILVTETSLSPRLNVLKNLLGIEVVQNVMMP